MVRKLFLLVKSLFSVFSFTPDIKLLCLGMFFVFSFTNATTYYTSASGPSTNLNSWWTNANGTGSHPALFSVAGDLFIIQSGHSMYTETAWYLGGKLEIQAGGTLAVGSNNITISGTTSISGALRFSFFTGVIRLRIFEGLVTVNTGGSWTDLTSSDFLFKAGITNNGTFTVGTGVYRFDINAQTLSGTLDIPRMTVVCDLTNDSSLTIATTLNGTGSLTNSSLGRLYLSGGSTIPTLSNAGTVVINGPGSSFTQAEFFTNTGTVNINGFGTIRGITNNADGTVNLNGSGAITGITNNAGGTVNLTSSGIITAFNNAGSTSRFNITASPVPTITTLTATTAGNTVIYGAAAGQTVKNTAYSNLTLSASGIKSMNGVTVNGVLSMEGTATVSRAPIYGASAALQYNTSTSRTAGLEWLNTFTGTGGVIVRNSGIITVNGTKVFNTSVPLTINSGAVLATADNTLTFGGNFINNGTLNAGSSSITINGNDVQSISGFTTTGDVFITKTANIATLTGVVSGNNFTIVTGPFLNLGNGLVHTAAGTLTLVGYAPVVLSGSWGGTGSAAAHINSNYFAAATGILNVFLTNCQQTVWNGAVWSNGVPDALRHVTFDAPFTITGDLSMCSCTINAGVDMVVPAGITLNITNSLTVAPAGSLTFEDTSSLLQISDVVNTGSIKYKRNTTPVRRMDFTYWSSPVYSSTFTLHSLSPNTLSDKYYRYDSNSGWVIDYNGSLVMDPAKGYIIRAPQTYDINTPAAYPASFVGVPNNGDISIIPVAGKSILLGNPYPSAVKADDFINGNTNVGALYFWTHKVLPSNVIPGEYKYNYTSDDYATYTLTGGTVTDSSYPVPTGMIASGQGFFTKASTGAAIIFTNDMRESGNNTQFYKTSQQQNLDRNRLWLNLSNTQGAFKQVLVGYLDGATNSWDMKYDAPTRNGNSYIDFYSINDAFKLTIQGRALPFEDTDIVPLGYKVTIKGEFTIAIDHADGLFKNQAVYLEDKTLDKITDLKASNYTFTTEIGAFTDRFVLHYKNKTLGNDDFESVENGLLVSVKNKTIKVTSLKENLKEVAVFDISGKLLYSKKKAGTNELQIQNLQSANQVLIVKVILENDFTATKKIIFN